MLSKKSLPDEITLIGMRPWRQMQQLIDLLREPLKKLELKQSTEVIFDAQCLWYMSLKTIFESHPICTDILKRLNQDLTPWHVESENHKRWFHSYHSERFGIQAHVQQDFDSCLKSHRSACFSLLT